MKRFIEFDVLRGALLLMMVINHSPSSLRLFTDEPLGFFTTAECFVFVSAFLAGMLFRKRAAKLGFAAARSSAIRRAGRIYRAHLATVGFSFVLGGFFLSEFPGIRNLLDHYLPNPWAAVGGSLVLLFRPPLMDILPMYVLFSLLTPVGFWAAERWGWKTVLLVSLSTWSIAQTHVRDLLVEASKGLPFVQLGPFDLLAWQLLWVSGLFIGQRFQEARAILPASRLLRLLLWISAIAFVAWRWRSIALGPDPVTRTWLLDKWHLGPLRLINFFVAASVIAGLLPYLRRLESPLSAFSLIGRHMLPVFCSQICLSVLLIGRTEPGLATEPVISALVLCQLSMAPLLAWFLEWGATAKDLAHPTPLLAALRGEKSGRLLLRNTGRLPYPYQTSSTMRSFFSRTASLAMQELPGQSGSRLGPPQGRKELAELTSLNGLAADRPRAAVKALKGVEENLALFCGR